MAHHLLSNSPVFSPLEITYTPLLLGGIFKLCGNRAPLEIKNKDKWIDLERKRWAKLFGVPVAASPPDGFPLSTLLVSLAGPGLMTEMVDWFDYGCHG